MSKLEVDAIEPQSGTTITIGSSGDTVNLVGTLQSNGSPLPGDISEVIAGTGLSGGGTTGAVTINIDSAQPTITSLGTITSFTSTGIDDNATSTAITIDSSERVGIGYSSTLNGNLNVDGNVGLGNFISASNPTGGTYNLTDPDGSNINQIVRIGEDDDSGNAVADLQLVSYGSNDNFGGGNLRFVNSRYSNDVALIKGSRESATTGYLAFYTENSGLKERMHIHDNGDISFYEDTGTTPKMFWDASTERLGIGTTSPSNLLDVKASSNNEDVIRISHPSSPTAAGALLGFNSDGTTDNNVITLGVHYSSDFYDVLNIQRSTRNVGIGTVNPQEQLDITSNVPRIRFTDLSVTNLRHVIGSEANDLEIRCDDGNVQASSHIGFKIDGSEKMRIDSSGNVLVGKTASNEDNAGIELLPSGRLIVTKAPNILAVFNVLGTGECHRFLTNGTLVGGITVGSSSTSYNTSSDYRLKENVSYDFDATTRIKQLKPARFNFIADADTTVDGFLAHEVQTVVPEAIFGTKDAVDEDGNPEYQGIDQSKLVPLLVKTIQELEARITTLENA